MFTQTKCLKLHFTQNAKLLILIILIAFWVIPVKAQLSGGSFDDVRPYDFSDFIPLTPKKFIETNFGIIKREYDKFPSTLVNGYRIEIIPNKRQGFRPSVSTHLIYNSLVDNAILDWAHQNKYDVSLNNGYQIVKDQDDGTKITINVTNSSWWPNPKKTIEQDFRDTHYTGSNLKFSELHKILSFESANSIELMRTKYGELSGEITKNQKTESINTNLEPLKEMILSMLNFCDDKTSKARLLFLEKIGNN